ncbi:MAG: hypothetical protein K2X77_30040 [Candidatus Obscuribacterales bacterium]|jgi:hypothetical protein|nr:hypothetical protein [Candidatus Obscuribacterales bacterium]
MTAIFGVIGVLFFALVLEVFFNIPTIERLRTGIDRLFAGKGYLRFFGLTAVFAAALYGVGIATMGPFLGIYNAAIEVGTLCTLVFFGGIVACFFGFARDVGARTREAFGGAEMKARPDTSILTSVVFVTCLWGCVILLTFYDHSVSGTLIGVSVNL